MTSYTRIMEMYNAEAREEDFCIVFGACFLGDSWMDFVPGTDMDPPEGGYFESWTFEGFDGDDGVYEFVDTFLAEIIAAGGTVTETFGDGDDLESLVLPDGIAKLAADWCGEYLGEGAM